MNEVDRCIGLEQIAPGALARMRLARYKQHLQAIADAFGGDHSAVVLKRNLAGEGCDRHFSIVAPAVLDIDWNVDGFAWACGERGGTAVVIGYGDLDGCRPCARSLIVDAEGEALLLADDAETR